MLNNRLDKLGDYPFRRLTALLADLAPPSDCVPRLLSIGEPQLPAPALMMPVLTESQAGFTKYPPAAGSPDWRQAVAGWLSRRYRLPDGFIDADRHVVPAPGTREALFLLGLTAIPTQKNGQTPAVVMPNPFYQVYAGAAVLGGAEPVFVDATEASGFLPDLDALSTELLARTAIFYLCTPANPQGTVAPLPYLRRLLALARQYDFVLALDECYAEIYADTPPPGGLEVALETGTLDHLLVFHSLSKRSSLPGLRSGFVAGDAGLIAALTRVMEYGGAGMPLPIQAVAAALWRDEAHVAAVRAVYRANFAAAERIIGSRWGRFTPPGGFFLWLNVGDGEAATRALWQHAGLKVLPGRYLARDQADGHNPGHAYIRVALVHPPDVTEAALGRLADCLHRQEGQNP
jgi:N-succinyldiaminopimelate aminotransferase